MTTPLLVSVVMPAYNRRVVVGAAVASVLWQTHGHLELIVVDDGSSDGTSEVAASYGDPRLVLVRQTNAGAGAARNTGLKRATGDVIAFVDSDDLLFPNYLDAMISTWRRHGGIVTANAYWLFPGGISARKTRHKGRFPPPREQRLALLQQNFVSTMSLFPRRMLADIGMFDVTLARNEDWDLWLRAVFAGYRVTHQPLPLALYRWTGFSLSTDLELVFTEETAILRRMAERPDLLPPEREYLERRLRHLPPRQLAIRADAAMRTGQYREAASLYREAAELCTSETMLVRKARLLGAAAPLVGPILRHRQLRREAALGMDPASAR